MVGKDLWRKGLASSLGGQCEVSCVKGGYVEGQPRVSKMPSMVLVEMFRLTAKEKSEFRKMVTKDGETLDFDRSSKHSYFWYLLQNSLRSSVSVKIMFSQKKNCWSLKGRSWSQLKMDARS